MTHETVTTTGAYAALTSPVWLPSLKEASEIAGLLLPILGALWLVTQITVKLWEARRKYKKDNESSD